MAVYDDTAAIGKLYRRQDEIGTPWCVTVDVDSLEDGAVTVRDRDSMAQERIPVEGVTRLILDRLDAARADDDRRSTAADAGVGEAVAGVARDAGRRPRARRRRSRSRTSPNAFAWDYRPGTRGGLTLGRHAGRPARGGPGRRRRGD